MTFFLISVEKNSKGQSQRKKKFERNKSAFKDNDVEL